MSEYIKVDGEIESFLRGKLDERLLEVTEKQRAFFGKIFPDGVPPDKLKSAIDLCDRTIRKNEAGR